jgi:hypothetical protein
MDNLGGSWISHIRMAYFTDIWLSICCSHDTCAIHVYGAQKYVQLQIPNPCTWFSMYGIYILFLHLNCQ